MKSQYKLRAWRKIEDSFPTFNAKDLRENDYHIKFVHNLIKVPKPTGIEEGSVIDNCFGVYSERANKSFSLFLASSRNKYFYEVNC